MKHKNRLIIFSIYFIICLFVIFISDYFLSQYGRGFGLLTTKLPAGIEIEYDNPQGYKFLEEGFIHLVDEHSVFEKDTIKSILAYSVTDDDVYIKSLTTRKKILYVNIHVSSSFRNNSKYQVRTYEITDNKKQWINLDNNNWIKFLLASRSLLICLLLILLLINIFLFIKRKILI